MRARTTESFLMTLAGVLLALVATSCVCPGHLGTKTVALDVLVKRPGIGIDYTGSDAKYHYFIRRNCYSLITLGEWSVTDRFRVEKDGIVARPEIALTKDRTLWRHYYLASPDQTAKFEVEFVNMRRGAPGAAFRETHGSAAGTLPAIH